MKFNEYASYDGLGLAALITGGEISASEAADAAYQAVEARNLELNAVLSTVTDQPFARSQPFSGVPFLVKELILQAKGAFSRAGSRATPAVKMPEDSNLMKRYREAGLQLVGTTQTPEMGYNATTETVAFGPVNNPWKAGYSAGGSSGGSGAAVAAGIVPIAHANDGGGSIRIPASCNGLVGLKPSRDRTPTGPGSSDPLFSHAIEFVLTRSVRDCAALLDCVAGPDLGAPHIIESPELSFAEAAAQKMKPSKIAFVESSLLGEPIHDECAIAANNAAKLLEEMGHTLIDCPLVLDFEEFAENTNIIWCAFAAQFVAQVSEVTGCRIDNDNFEAVTLTCAEFGNQTNAPQILNALDYVNRISRQTAAAFEDFDVILSSTMSAPPAAHGFLNQNDDQISAIDWTRKTFQYASNTPLFNSTGQPAISLPTHWTADGLPVGIQLAAGMGQEGLLLNLATGLETANDWNSRQRSLFS